MKQRLQTYLAQVVRKLTPIDRTPRPRLDEEPLTLLPHLDADLMAAILAEAQDGLTERLFTLYRDIMVDSHLQGEFNKRKLAVLKERPQFAPEEKDEDECSAACEEIERMWRNAQGKREALTHLLDSALYPVAVVEKIWRPSRAPGRSYDLDRLVPVPHHLLDYRQNGMRIRKVNHDGRLLEDWHEPDPARYLIHRGHLLTSHPDKWGGPMRAVVFWFLFKTMNREWWARFLDRFGCPFLVGKYDTADERNRSELIHAFSHAQRLFGLAIPREASVEMVQHGGGQGQGGSGFQKFAEHANSELSKLIVGQTMTTEAGPGGIGGGQADVHQAVRDDIAAFDASALVETLTDQLFRQHLLVNGYTDTPPVMSFGGMGQADATALAALIKALGEAGYEPGEGAEEYLSHAAGFQVQRKPPTPSLPSLALAADDPTIELAENSSAALSRALGDKLAALPRLVRESRSKDDLEDRLIKHLQAGNPPAQNLLADALTTHALNATDRLP